MNYYSHACLDLTDTRDCALSIASDLNYARALARDLINELDLSCALDSEIIRSHALARDLARAIHYALGIAGTVSNTSDLDPGLISSFNSAFASAYARASLIEGDFYLVPDFPKAYGLTVKITQILYSVRAYARAFVGPGVSTQAEKGCLARGAVRLAGAAVAMLSPEDRPRYSEEYRSELADLVCAGVSRWRQHCYAGRLLICAGALRITLALARRHREAA